MTKPIYIVQRKGFLSYKVVRVDKASEVKFSHITRSGANRQAESLNKFVEKMQYLTS